MDRIACVGLSPADVGVVKAKYHGHVVVYETPPRMYSHEGKLFAESTNVMGKWLEIERVAWYGYFPGNDLSTDVRKAIALSDAPSFPNIRRTILHDDRALSLIQAEIADPAEPMHRGYAPRGSRALFKERAVFKTGNDHCGDGKFLIEGLTPDSAFAAHSGVLEPFVQGDSIRALMVGQKLWMLKYESADWRKNVKGTVQEIHPAEVIGVQSRARVIHEAIGIPTLGIDFIGSNDTGWKLLEVNAYPGLDDVVEAHEGFRELLGSFAGDKYGIVS